MIVLSLIELLEKNFHFYQAVMVCKWYVFLYMHFSSVDDHSKSFTTGRFIAIRPFTHTHSCTAGLFLWGGTIQGSVSSPNLWCSDCCALEDSAAGPLSAPKHWNRSSISYWICLCANCFAEDMHWGLGYSPDYHTMCLLGLFVT